MSGLQNSQLNSCHGGGFKICSRSDRWSHAEYFQFSFWKFAQIMKISLRFFYRDKILKHTNLNTNSIHFWRNFSNQHHRSRHFQCEHVRKIKRISELFQIEWGSRTRSLSRSSGSTHDLNETRAARRHGSFFSPSQFYGHQLFTLNYFFTIRKSNAAGIYNLSLLSPRQKKPNHVHVAFFFDSSSRFRDKTNFLNWFFRFLSC